MLYLGSSYEGSIVNGKMTGSGTFKSKSFEYTGGFKKNKPDGEGRLDFNDGIDLKNKSIVFDKNNTIFRNIFL